MSNTGTVSTTLAGTVQAAIPHAKGFDTTQVISPTLAQAFVSAGYQFAVRYVHRVPTGENSPTLSTQEANTILNAGMALMVVQYYAGDGWAPDGPTGANYGANAAMFARQIGVPAGVNLWCDLEGVGGGTPAQNIIDYCNSWYAQVESAGYVPGLYVGYGNGLDSQQLYDLAFQHYWSSYNLNLDQYPAVRGVQMRQSSSSEGIGQPNTPDHIAAGNYDIDTTQTDALGGNAIWLAPAGA